MTNHTPGPWAIRDDDEDGVVSIVGSSQIVLARVRTATVEPGDENARLIAAAPELLDALIALHDKLAINNDSGAYSDLIWSSRAAIAKALGS